MKVEMIVEKTKTGYSAYAVKYNVFTTGKSLQQLKKNMLESINLFFEESGKTAIDIQQLKITLDLPQFFSFYKVLNAKALSERIGMNQSLLAQYISGNKIPSLQQTKRILDGVREVGKELAEINFR
ncbi:MAG: XRE family transcriptional regulator [Sphingobacteriia bacterium]|nr:MAG: XRE family transcriptional regulator [Sphingobacteriia bacterium]